MKRKRPSVEIRKSDHPNKRRRITAMSILLPTELVRRISEFVIELTHAQFLKLQLRTRNIEMTRRKQTRENRLYQMSHVVMTLPGVPSWLHTIVSPDYYSYKRRYGPGF